MHESPSQHISIMQADSSHHSSTSNSAIIQILVLAEEHSDEQHSNKQHAEPSTKLPQPPPAAKSSFSASAATLPMHLLELACRVCSKQSPAAAECRICLSAGNAEQELIQPCACTGTMGYIHAACLTHWVQEKGSLTCELCKQQYQEPYVQALELEAAADKAQHTDNVGPAADDSVNNASQSWKRLRFWLLLLLSLFIVAFIAVTVTLFNLNKNHSSTPAGPLSQPDDEVWKCGRWCVHGL